MKHDPTWQENEMLEFKPSLNALHSERGSERDGIATVCAFANHKGGALQEAILNAVIHRDYRISGHIFIRHYPDRIEIISPGQFLDAISPANILGHPPRFRNPSLALLLSRVFAVQQAGQGVDLIVNASAKRGAMPVYETNLPKDELKKWNIAEALTEKTVSSLVERNVLEFFGDRKARRYFLARHIYHLLGEAGELTRSLGPSSKGIEATILDHLELYGKGTIHDFMIALSLSPNDKRQRDRIGKVLKSLKRKGVIAMVKSREKAHYERIFKSV